MGMKFVKDLLKELDITPYRLAKLVGVTQQSVRKWAGITKTKTPQAGINLTALCKLRQLSGKTWNELGKAIDQEFLEK